MGSRSARAIEGAPSQPVFLNRFFKCAGKVLPCDRRRHSGHIGDSGVRGRIPGRGRAQARIPRSCTFSRCASTAFEKASCLVTMMTMPFALGMATTEPTSTTSSLCQAMRWCYCWFRRFSSADLRGESAAWAAASSPLPALVDLLAVSAEIESPLRHALAIGVVNARRLPLTDAR